jgi:hypothetical protein
VLTDDEFLVLTKAAGADLRDILRLDGPEADGGYYVRRRLFAALQGTSELVKERTDRRGAVERVYLVSFTGGTDVYITLKYLTDDYGRPQMSHRGDKRTVLCVAAEEVEVLDP